MNQLKHQLLGRKSDIFYGFEASPLLEGHTTSNKLKIEDFHLFLDSALDSFDRWFDYSDYNYLSKLVCLNNPSNITFMKLVSIPKSKVSWIWMLYMKNCAILTSQYTSHSCNLQPYKNGNNCFCSSEIFIQFAHYIESGFKHSGDKGFLWTSVFPHGFQLVGHEVWFEFGVDKERNTSWNKLHIFLSRISQNFYE